jgi:hypothetical protein
MIKEDENEHESQENKTFLQGKLSLRQHSDEYIQILKKRGYMGKK